MRVRYPSYEGQLPLILGPLPSYEGQVPIISGTPTPHFRGTNHQTVSHKMLVTHKLQLVTHKLMLVKNSKCQSHTLMLVTNSKCQSNTNSQIRNFSHIPSCQSDNVSCTQTHVSQKFKMLVTNQIMLVTNLKGQSHTNHLSHKFEILVTHSLSLYIFVSSLCRRSFEIKVKYCSMTCLKLEQEILFSFLTSFDIFSKSPNSPNF